MSFHRSGSLSSGFNMNISVKNEPDDRFDYVNFDTDNLKYQRTFHDHQLENDDPTFEILLLPEITRSSTFSCSSTSKYSPTNQTSQHQIIQNHYSSPGNQLNNNKNMNMNMNESVVELIQQSSVDDNNQVGVSSTRTALSNIQDFVETTIVLRKDKKNQLGISIVGGNDTYLESICVNEVHQDSAAHQDGRLRKGDLILAVNEVSLRSVFFYEAVKVLRESPSPLRLMILRENAQKLFTTHQSPCKFITVELRKGSIKDKLGLSIMQRTNGRGVFITYILPGSIASQHSRRIMQGDQILEINGQNVRESNQKDVSNILCNLDGAIVLLLGRVPAVTSAIQEWARKKAQICSRTRTSTWSAYSASCHEKLQTQRPSLPVNKENTYFNGNLLSPESDIGCCNIIGGGISPSISQNFDQQEIPSRTSSIRSRSRLSIVNEDFKSIDPNGNKEEDNDDNDSDDGDRSCDELGNLPSIKVTEF